VLVDGGVPVGGGGWMDVILLLWTRAAPVHMPRLARPTTARPGLAGTMWRCNNHRRRRPCSYIILYYIILLYTTYGSLCVLWENMPICRHRTHVNWFLSFNVGILYISEFFTPDVHIMEQEGSSFLYIILFFIFFTLLFETQSAIYIYKTPIIIQYIYIYRFLHACTQI